MASPGTEAPGTAAPGTGHEQKALDKVIVFWARCPLGEQCSRKGGVLCKKSTEAEARASVAWHLQASPYHSLGKEEAEDLAKVCSIDPHEEEKKTAEEEQQEDGQGWYQARKRQKWGHKNHVSNVDEALDVLSRAGMLAKSSSSSSSAVQLVPAKGKGNHEGSQHVLLNKVQLRACIDSLNRGKVAAESAGQLCSKAARAFYEEAACITNCREVLESYLPE